MMCLRCRDTGAGFALIGVLVMMVTTGLMVSGIFLWALADSRQGRNSLLVEQGFRASEVGLAAVLSSNEMAPMNGPAGTGRVEADWVGMGRAHALVRSVGFSAGDLARRETAVLVEFRTPGFLKPLAALTATGVDGGLGIWASGIDSAGMGPDCQPPLDVPGAIFSGDTTVFSICPTCLEGNPPVLVGDSLVNSVPGPRFEALKETADYSFGGGTLRRIGPKYMSAAECDTSNPNNWGDWRTTGPCSQHRPVIHSSGDLVVIGGGGQGILIVDGGLELSGGFEFDGLVVVRGQLKIGNDGALIRGAVVAGHMVFPKNSSFSGPFVQYSSCAVELASRNHRVGTPLERRSWVPLY